MRATDPSVAESGAAEGAWKDMSLKEEGEGYMHSSDNRGVWITNDCGAL